jgi:hypothetical protein
MITGRRIAGSLIAAAALSLTLVPVAAAEPKAAPREEVGSHDQGAKRGTLVSIVCAVIGKPSHGKAPHLSADDIKRVIKLRDVKLPHGKVHSCKIISTAPGDRTVISRAEGAPPALKQFHK